MKKKILITLGLVVIIVLAVLFSFPDETVSYYDTDSTLSNNIGDLVKDKEVRMEFVADKNNLGSIALKIGTYGRKNLTTMDVQILNEEKQLVVQKSINLMDIADNEYFKISFDSIVESRNKTFTVIISSPDATNEKSVAPYTYQRKGNTTHLYVDGEEQSSALAFRASYYNNFDITTFIVFLYFIAVIIGFVIFIYKFI